MTDRDMTPAQRRALERQVSSAVLLAFVKIEHPNLATPLYLVADAMDYLRDGILWTGLLFKVTPPSDNDSAPQATITVPNTDRRIGLALRTLTERAMVTLDICTSDDFNLALDPREPLGPVTRLYPAVRYELVDVECSVAELSGTLMIRDFAQEPWPAIFATQSKVPGSFR
jgi:hypothetical protein